MAVWPVMSEHKAGLSRQPTGSSANPAKINKIFREIRQSSDDSPESYLAAFYFY